MGETLGRKRNGWQQWQGSLCRHFLNDKVVGEMPFLRRDVQMCERSIRSPQPSWRLATLLVSGNEGAVAAVTDQGGWLADMPGEAGAHGKKPLVLGVLE